MPFTGRLGAMFSVLLCASMGLAQQKVSAPKAAASSSQSQSIRLDVVVTAKHGWEPVSGLTVADFTVVDNMAPRKVTAFAARGGSDSQVEVILVVDAVNAWYRTVTFEKGEIERFLQANGGHLEYPTQLVLFTDTSTQIQNGFSKDGNMLSTGLDQLEVGLRSIRQSSGIYGESERMGLSIKALQMLIARESRFPGRKIVLWISPGWPLLSSPWIHVNNKEQVDTFNTIEALSTALRQAQITLYSIDPLGMTDAGTLNVSAYQSFRKPVRKPQDAQFGDLALQILAEQTGGQVLNSSNDITKLLEKAMKDTGTYYELSFDAAADEPNMYHALEIKVDKPGLVARTRAGYYSR